MKNTLKILALVWVLLAFPQVMQAQTGASLTLRLLQTELFPQITGFVDARNANGAFLADLTAEDLVAVEDGSPQSLEQLRLVETGLRLIVAFNPAQSFAIRNSQGSTRYELVKEEILAWSDALPKDGGPSLALLSPEGLQRSFTNPETWTEAYEEYLPDLSPSEANLQVVGEALQVLVQPEEQQPGQGAALWLVSATPEVGDPSVLEALQQQALERGMRVFVWLVDAPSRLESETALAMQDLALSTGGAFFAFSGDEEFPNVEAYFDSLGRAYLFQYTSQLRTQGEHSIGLQFAGEEGDASTQPFTFELEIEPPEPIFVSPPAQIERAPSKEDPQSLAPFNQPLEIIVEFPDGVDRNLVRTTLYVNGDRQAENHTAPFNHFVWGLSGYTTSQRVFIQVEVEDEFGMVGASIELPVEITVQPPAGNLRNFVARNAGLFTLSVAVLAAGAVLAILVLSGRIAPPPLRTQRFQPRRVEESDPLLQSPLDDEDAAYNRFDQETPAQANPLASAQSTWAYLQPIDPGETSVADGFIPLRTGEVLLGQDPAAGVVIEDNSVQAQHAKLRRLESGECELADLGSEAGTWLNYAPVSPEGSPVQDGDLIHIGRVPFRFRLNR